MQSVISSLQSVVCSLQSAVCGLQSAVCSLQMSDTVLLPTPIYQLLPPKKQRFLRNKGHDFIFPAVKLERYRRSFINRCHFNFI